MQIKFCFRWHVTWPWQWDFDNDRNRDLGREIFKKMMNLTISSGYHKSGTRTQWGLDQDFLKDHVYPLIKARSIIHDSFMCAQFNDSRPFPTRPNGNCLGSAGECETNKQFFECPISRRPAEHKNRTLCWNKIFWWLSERLYQILNFLQLVTNFYKRTYFLEIEY